MIPESVLSFHDSMDVACMILWKWLHDYGCGFIVRYNLGKLLCEDQRSHLLSAPVYYFLNYVQRRSYEDMVPSHDTHVTPPPPRRVSLTKCGN